MDRTSGPLHFNRAVEFIFVTDRTSGPLHFNRAVKFIYFCKEPLQWLNPLHLGPILIWLCNDLNQWPISFQILLLGCFQCLSLSKLTQVLLSLVHSTKIVDLVSIKIFSCEGGSVVNPQLYQLVVHIYFDYLKCNDVLSHPASFICKFILEGQVIMSQVHYNDFGH